MAGLQLLSLTELMELASFQDLKQRETLVSDNYSDHPAVCCKLPNQKIFCSSLFKSYLRR